MEDDPFLQRFDSSDLQIAKEFLTNWLPFLTKNLCEGCATSIFDRIRSLNPESDQEGVKERVEDSGSGIVEESSDLVNGCFGASTEGWEHIKATGWGTDSTQETRKVRMSWADELDEEEEEARKNMLDDVMEGKVELKLKKAELSRDQRERIRFTNVGRKKDFVCLEGVDGKMVNILEGLELHTGVFSAVEQKRIVDFVYELQEKGKNDDLGEYTYSEESESRNYMLNKGCAKLQFGCFSYEEQNGNPPGILCDVVTDPMPKLFKLIIRRLIRWHVIPISCVPDSCCVNIYEPGDIGSPDIESRDFDHPICIVSFLSSYNVNFGVKRKDADGEVMESFAIPFPNGSVLVLNDKGADVAKHWVSADTNKRMAITFRKINPNKQPLGFHAEPDLQGIFPIDFTPFDTKTESFIEITTVGRGRKFSNGGRRSNGAKGRSYRKDESSVFNRIITPTKKSYNPTNHSSIEKGRSYRPFFEPEYDAGLYDHPYESEELPESSHRGGINNRNKVSSERSVVMEEQRIIINRNLDKEGASFNRSLDFYPDHSPVRIRTLNNNQRRV